MKQAAGSSFGSDLSFSVRTRPDNLLRLPEKSLTRMLRHAIATDSIVPAFQPLLDMRTRRISGFEILARWHDPEQGTISPAEFIPLAEAEGLLKPLTESLLRCACTAAMDWAPHLTLAVNISPLQLQDPDLAQMIWRAVEPTKFPLCRLEVELTEQALVGSIEVARAAFLELKSLGMRMVLDDFGTGHAGLNRLQELPFDKIKIDGSFIRALDRGKDGRKIVAAMINLGLSLGVATVAEGVEEQSQADMLRRLGCGVSQGWLYGRAVTADRVPDMLTAAADLVPATPDPHVSEMFPADLPFNERLTKLEGIFQAAPVGLCFLDLCFRYVTVNECFARMYHQPAENFIGRTVSEVLPALAPQIVAHLERALAAEGTVECEIMVDDASYGGTDQTFYQRAAQPVWDATGEIVGLSVASIDVTERRRTETALRESEENFRHMAELSPHISWTAKASGELLFVSARWFALTGVVPETMLRDGWIQALHLEDRENAIRQWTRSLESGELYDVSFRIKCLVGGWRWMRSRALPRRSSAGEIIRWYGTVDDVHEQKETEAALRTKTQRLKVTADKLTWRAREDHLTGLPNRGQFDKLIKSEIGRARRSKLPLAMIMFDVDLFKGYNDTYGHVMGDECLRAVAQAAAGVLMRPADFAARYGGEEFAIVLPDTDEAGAMDIARKALDAVRALELPHESSPMKTVTISAGVGTLDIQGGKTVAALLSRLVEGADQALYEAKEDGRNRVVGAGSLICA